MRSSCRRLETAPDSIESTCWFRNAILAMFRLRQLSTSAISNLAISPPKKSRTSSLASELYSTVADAPLSMVSDNCRRFTSAAPPAMISESRVLRMAYVGGGLLISNVSNDCNSLKTPLSVLLMVFPFRFNESESLHYAMCKYHCCISTINVRLSLVLILTFARPCSRLYFLILFCCASELRFLRI